MNELFLGILLVVAVICFVFYMRQTYKEIDASNRKYNEEMKLLSDFKDIFENNSNMVDSVVARKGDLELDNVQLVAYCNFMHASMSVDHYYTENTVIGDFSNQKDVYKEVVSLYNKAIEAKVAFFKTLED